MAAAQAVVTNGWPRQAALQDIAGKEFSIENSVEGQNQIVGKTN